MSKKKLDRMKEEYNNYPVPEEAKRRVEQSIERVRKEKNKDIVILWVKRSGAAAAAAMLTLTVLTNTNSTIAHALEKIPVIGTFTKVVTFRTYEDKSDNFEAKIEVPQIVEEKENNKALTESEQKVNKSVKEYTNELVKRYESDMREYGNKAHEAMDSSYKVVTDNDRLFTLRIDTVVAVGSSDAFSKFYHIDKNTDKVVTLEDLFVKDSDYIRVISEEIIRQMREQMSKDENKLYFLDDDMGDEFNFKSIKEDQNFYVENGKMVIVFDKYEAAPGYMGQPEFVISPEILKGILIEDSVIE